MTSRAEYRTAVIVTLLLALAALGGTAGWAWAAFNASARSSGNKLSAAPDWVAPRASSSVIGKAQGGTPGFIRQGGAYTVYADVSDTGSPASGVASAVGNLSAITTGQGGSALSPGSFAFGGTSYNYRTGNLTANATLAAGTYTYSLTATDVAGNTGTQTGYTVTVDNTAPTASDVQTTNKTGNIAGRPEIGDTAILTFSEPIEPNSVLAGWTGGPTSVVARIDNSSPPNNRFTVYNAGNTTQLALGSVNLQRPDYITANATFGLTGTASTMSLTGNTITVTLGTASAGPATTATAAAMVWSPSVTATDRAGNAESATTRTETGASDKDF